MDRREAVLRELNLYPLWQRRNQPAQTAMSAVGAIHESPAAQIGAMTTDRAIDETTSHSTRLSKNDNQVAGYHESPLRDWPQLKDTVRDCTACRLRAGCTQTVFGVGDESAGWLFVGEGPGADEDALGEPFVGQAGKLLDNMLMAIRLKRGENVYIANIVKCRPPGNRAPAADEIAQCLPYLQRQIELIQPKLIVALGKVASNALLGRETTIASLRGKLHDYQLATATGLDGGQGDESSRLPPIPHQTTSSHRVRTTIPLIVTYHPAYLLRSPTEKAKAWQDLCLATDTMKKLQ